jgi:hypothetical protein
MAMKKPVKIILALNLMVIAILVFVFPQLMVSPGKLIPGHHALEGDCFACHAAFTGASAERCMNCHAPKDIGRLTTRGEPIAKPLTKVPFHQDLIKQDCVSCHGDHAGTMRLTPQGRFNHALLRADARSTCANCHVAPKDSLHRKITDNCGQCHSQSRWQPATFDHGRMFRLDRDHDVSCSVCHVSNDFSRYTCYGCHEHSPERIRREHIEEGIRDFKNCTECHRSANEHDIRMPERFGRNEGRSGRDHEHEDDD